LKEITKDTQILTAKLETRDQPMFGFCQYIGNGQIGLSGCWQKAVIFFTHLDNLRKKAQRSKSRQSSQSNASRCSFINKQTRLTMQQASAIAPETKASSGSFAMLEATDAIGNPQQHVRKASHRGSKQQ